MILNLHTLLATTRVIWIRACTLLRAKSNGILCLWDSLTIWSKTQTVNLLNTALGHNVVEHMKFPFLWSFLPLQSLRCCKWSLIILGSVTVLHGVSPVFLLYEIAIQLTPSFQYHVSLLLHPSYSFVIATLSCSQGWWQERKNS